MAIFARQFHSNIIMERGCWACNGAVLAWMPHPPSSTNNTCPTARRNTSEGFGNGRPQIYTEYWIYMLVHINETTVMLCSPLIGNFRTVRIHPRSSYLRECPSHSNQHSGVVPKYAFAGKFRTLPPTTFIIGGLTRDPSSGHALLTLILPAAF